MKNIYFLFCLLYFSFNLNAQEISKEYIYFSSDEAELSIASINIIDSFIISLLELENPEVKLTGHTDNRGAHDYNLSLSKRRVDAVLNYFKEKNVDVSNVELDYFGETIPVATNEKEVDRKLNRRVELTLLGQKKEEIIVEDNLEAAPLASAIEFENEYSTSFENPMEVLVDLGSKPQSFCIQNHRDTILQGEDGTILFLKAESFDPKEIDCACVEIQLREFYSPAQILLNNLNTQSGNRILETQGAIKVEAFCNEKTLQLKRGKKIDIYFPDLAGEDAFYLFRGNETANGKVDWKKNTRNFSSDFNPTVGGRNAMSGASYKHCNYNFFLKRWFCNRKNKKLRKIAQRNANYWLNDLVEKYGDISFVNVKMNIDQETLQIFTSNQLGFINCDRFLKYPPQQLASIFVKDSKKQKKQKKQRMMTAIVFKDIKSVMSGNVDEKGRHWFINIPKNNEVWVVAIKKEKDTYHLAIRDQVLDDEPIENLVFQEVSTTELKESLKEIGW